MYIQLKYLPGPDVSTGATSMTAVAHKFSGTLSLFQHGAADSAHHRRGRTIKTCILF